MVTEGYGYRGLNCALHHSYTSLEARRNCGANSITDAVVRALRGNRLKRERAPGAGDETNHYGHGNADSFHDTCPFRQILPMFGRSLFVSFCLFFVVIHSIDDAFMASIRFMEWTYSSYPPRPLFPRPCPPPLPSRLPFPGPSPLRQPGPKPPVPSPGQTQFFMILLNASIWSGCRISRSWSK